MTFEEWWVQLKPAEVDELKEIFRECWETVCQEQQHTAFLVEGTDHA